MIQKELLDQYPISLKYIQPIIDRIHHRYPALSRYEIVVIVKQFFETIRYLMFVEDKILSINTWFANLRLEPAKFTGPTAKQRPNVINIKCKLTTPGKIKTNV